ncbi:hypothetical protein PPMP20_17260 [Paraburkholderia phymatum]|uniref:Transmembrane protein n=1 Tax=Paraburkholderia phymatum (strain DSM 17167 / CIP 108236 / LMG 21445 / STM815) TaxID=391038 RepID=B2JTB3_PARP8|nr:hypothetical protein [Paraburkholderia phymatum]ACC75816.1 hypothetical protein Bphy_6798 [Paraburkholderia phymatum STM815]
MDLVVRIWKDPVWSKLIATVIGASSTAVWAHVEGYLTLATVQHAASAAYDLLTTDYPYQPWRIVVGTVAAAAIGAWMMRLRMQKRIDAAYEAVEYPQQPSSEAKPASPATYLTDVLFGFRWRWKIAAKSGDVYGMKLYCPECDYELQPAAFDYPYGGGAVCECDNCHYKQGIGSDDPALFMNKAKLEAERRWRTGEWKEQRADRS